MNINIDISVCRVCMSSGDGISLFDNQELTTKYQLCTELLVNDLLLLLSHVPKIF